MKATLKERISTRTDVRIGVIGVGYVGLPLAVRLAEEKFSVIGIDVSPAVVKKLRAGKSTVEGIGDERLKKVVGKALKLLVVNKNNPAATSRRILDSLVGVDVFLVCVPTPLDQLKQWEPDTRYIVQARNLIERIFEIEKSSEFFRRNVC